MSSHSSRQTAQPAKATQKRAAQRKLYEMLAQERDLLRTLIDNMPDFIYVKDAASRFLIANVAVAQVMGAKTPADLLGKTDHDFYPPELADRYLADEREVLTRGEPLIGREEPVRDAAGNLRWISTTKVPLRDEEGKVIGLVGIGRDITDKKKAEAALRRYNERLEAIHKMDQAILAARTLEEIAQAAVRYVCRLLACRGAGVLLFDADAQNVRLLALEAEGKFGLKGGDVYPLEDFPRLPELREGRVLTVEDLTSLPAPSLAERRLLQEGLRAYMTVPLRTEGELVGLLTLGCAEPHSFAPEEVEVAQEISTQLAIALRQARLHHQLEETNAMLRKALAAKDEMIANVSHELRTPLTQIIGYGELLVDGILQGLEFSAEQRHAIEVILDRAYTLNRLVDALLTLQTLTREDLAWLEIDLKTLAETALERWQSGQKQEMHVQVEVPASLPRIRGDAARLCQALGQLLDNAAKFGGEAKTIFIKAWQQGQEVCLSISDRGIGIPPDRLEEIFNLFYQVNGSSTRRYGGMGIGLALVRHIINLHGGRVWAESEGIPGRGATFTLALPIA